MQAFGEMDTRHLGQPTPSPQIIICPGAHFSRCPFNPNINFFQQPICPKFPFISMPICSRFFFSICPVPMCPSPYLSQVPICPKSPFTPNSPYLQMPICHSAHHFPKFPFAQVPISPKCPILRDPNVWDPSFSRDPYCLIRSQAVLQTVSCDSIQSNAVLYKRFVAVPHGLMNGSMRYRLVPQVSCGLANSSTRSHAVFGSTVVCTLPLLMRCNHLEFDCTNSVRATVTRWR